MKKFFFTLFILPLFAFAQNKNFTITGNITGLGDGEVKITSTQNSQVVASGQSKNGAFSLQGTVPEPALYWLTIGKEQPVYVFIENSPMKVTGSHTNIQGIKLEGSKSHQDFLDFQHVFNPIIGELNSLAAQLQQTHDNKREALMNNYNAAVAKMNAEVVNFITKKPKSFVSPFLLSITAQVSEHPNELERRFYLLDETIRTSETGKTLSNYIAYMKVGSVGTDAIEFTQNDTADKPVSLSAFKGKYVLVDFWASWCRPCRIENPNVVNAYNKFKNKNFTILGVSLDSDKNAWIQAINKDHLQQWTHVSDLQQWNNAVAVMYHVQSIPQNFLLDPSGKIIAKDLRGEDLEKKLCELLGCK